LCIRHFGVILATVTLNFVTGTFKLTVADNGCGFSPPDNLADFAPGGKLGLQRMEQQSHLLNGTFKISSHPSKGTVITVEAIP
jgi:two-component system sensor histidine kinase DegS